jgi:hypothetical protein
MAVFPYQVGQLYNGGIQNGQQIYTQPGGIGTPVFPQPPRVNPPPNWKNSAWLPSYPYAYIGLLTWGCGHWTNTCEAYTVDDPTTGEQAALLCCPVCSYIGYIIEPAINWWQEFYSVYPVGIRQPGGGLIPNEG